MTFLVSDLERSQKRVDQLETVIIECSKLNCDEKLLRSIRGVSYFSATSLVCRVGNVQRFPRARSLANLLGTHAGML